MQLHYIIWEMLTITQRIAVAASATFPVWHVSNWGRAYHPSSNTLLQQVLCFWNRRGVAMDYDGLCFATKSLLQKFFYNKTLVAKIAKQTRVKKKKIATKQLLQQDSCCKNKIILQQSLCCNGEDAFSRSMQHIILASDPADLLKRSAGGRVARPI